MKYTVKKRFDHMNASSDQYANEWPKDEPVPQPMSMIRINIDYPGPINSTFYIMLLDVAYEFYFF